MTTEFLNNEEIELIINNIQNTSLINSVKLKENVKFFGNYFQVKYTIINLDETLNEICLCLYVKGKKFTEIQIDKLDIDNYHQRRGHGTTLINQTKELMKIFNVPMICGNSWTKDSTEFYKSCGFIFPDKSNRFEYRCNYK